MERIEKYINREWLFCYGENIGAENDTKFEDYISIGLPHTFTLPYYGENEFYTGYGVYVKQLEIKHEWLNQRVVLEFGAVFQVAEVYLNGESVTIHEGGYTAFIADLSSHIRLGDNTLVVRVNNNWSPIIAPRAGEHTFCGGVYRDVKLIVTQNSYIDWYGIRVTTPIISSESAVIAIEVDTTNCLELEMKATILDNDKNIVATTSQIIACDRSNLTINIKSPKLWDINTPYLYTLKVQVKEDCQHVNFGVRTIKWDKDKGFFINGRRLLLQGANVHQDHGGWGDAVTHAGIHRDIKMMKDCGMNFIRGSHYPHHTQFAEECDRQGILFWSESVFWGIGGFSDEGYWDSSATPTNRGDIDEFEKSLINTTTEMIKTNRNHPSIVAWCVGNEIFFSNKNVINDAKAIVSRIVELAHGLDSSRLCGVGGVQREGFDQLGDIAGYNGDGAVLYKNPHLPNIVAEYGSIPSYRPGNHSLNFTKGSDDHYDWRAGRAIWCGFHHGSIANIGNLGIVDLYRLPLQSWYAYREKYKGIVIPKLAKACTPTQLVISSDRMTISSDGLSDCQLIIEACDNNGDRVSCNIEVTLKVVSGGGLLPTGRVMKFSQATKSFFDGACAIELRSYYAGVTRIIAESEGLISGEIDIEVTGDIPYDGRTIEINTQPNFDRRIRRSGSDIIANRPVVVTSESHISSAMNISDGNRKTYWRPSFDDKSPQVTLDLENMYSEFDLSVELYKRLNSGTIKVMIKVDGVWVVVKETSISRWRKKYAFRVDKMTRFIKLSFTNTRQSIMIRRVKALSSTR